MAASPIQYEAIMAFCRLNGIRMTPWEIETLELMDDAALAGSHEGGASNETVAHSGPDIPVKNGPAIGALLRGLAVVHNKG